MTARSLESFLQSEHRRVDAQLHQSALQALTFPTASSRCRAADFLKLMPIQRMKKLLLKEQSSPGLLPLNSFIDAFRKACKGSRLSNAELRRFAAEFRSNRADLPQNAFFIDTKRMLNYLIQTRPSSRKNSIGLEYESKDASEDEDQVAKAGDLHENPSHAAFNRTVEQIKRKRLGATKALRVFRSFSRGNPARLQTRELPAALAALGIFPSRHELRSLIHFIDADASGRIKPEALVHLFTLPVNPQPRSRCKYELCHGVLVDLFRHNWKSLASLISSETSRAFVKELKRLEMRDVSKEDIALLLQGRRFCADDVLRTVFHSLNVPMGNSSRMGRRLEMADVEGEGRLSVTRFRSVLERSVGKGGGVKECVEWFEKDGWVDVEIFIRAQSRARVAEAIRKRIDDIFALQEKTSKGAVEVVKRFAKGVKQSEIEEFLQEFSLIDVEGRLRKRRLETLFDYSRYGKAFMGKNRQSAVDYKGRLSQGSFKDFLRHVVSGIHSNAVSTKAFRSALERAGLAKMTAEEAAPVSSLISNFSLPGPRSRIDVEGIRVFLYDEKDKVEELQSENALLRKELSAFDAEFFKEIEGLRRGYQRAVEKNEELETSAWRDFVESNGETPVPNTFAKVDRALHSATAQRLRSQEEEEADSFDGSDVVELRSSPRRYYPKDAFHRGSFYAGEEEEEEEEEKTFDRFNEGLTTPFRSLAKTKNRLAQLNAKPYLDLDRNEETTNIMPDSDDEESDLSEESSCSWNPLKTVSDARREMVRHWMKARHDRELKSALRSTFYKMAGDEDGRLDAEGILKLLRKLRLKSRMSREDVRAIVTELEGLDLKGFRRKVREWRSYDSQKVLCNSWPLDKSPQVWPPQEQMSSSWIEHETDSQLSRYEREGSPERNLLYKDNLEQHRSTKVIRPYKHKAEIFDIFDTAEESIGSDAESEDTSEEQGELEELESELRKRLQRLKVGPSLHRQLNRFDADQDGMLSLSEFADMASSLGLRLSTLQLHRLMQEISPPRRANQPPIVSLSDIKAFAEIQQNGPDKSIVALRKLRTKGHDISRKRLFCEEQISLKSFIEKVGIAGVEHSEARALFWKLDGNQNGHVCGRHVMLALVEREKIVKQWRRWMKASPDDNLSRADLVASLKRFRMSSAGFMAPNDALRALKQIGATVAQWQAESLVQMATCSKNGLISVRGLAALLLPNSRSCQWQDSQDASVKCRNESPRRRNLEKEPEDPSPDCPIPDLHETVASILLTARKNTRGLLRLREEPVSRDGLAAFFNRHFGMNLSKETARIVFEVCDEQGKGLLLSTDLLRQILSQETLRLALEVDEASEVDAARAGQEMEKKLRRHVLQGREANFALRPKKVESAYARLLRSNGKAEVGIVRIEDLFDVCKELGICSANSWSMQVAFHRMCNRSVKTFAQAFAHGFSLVHMLDWLFPLSDAQQHLERLFLRALHETEKAHGQQKNTSIEKYVREAKKILPQCAEKDARLLGIRKWASDQQKQE